MNRILIYLLEVAVTLAICAAVVAYLRPYLQRILVDLCGTAERAQFWQVFATILLVGLPLIFGLGYQPESHASEQLFFEVANQLKVNLLGFLLALIAIGGVVSFFALVAPRTQAKAD
jgi:hypothetical protein